MEGQENKNSVSEISKKLDGIQQGLEASVKDIKENLVNETKSLVDSEIKKINESVETQFKKINESNDKFQNTVEEFVNNTKTIAKSGKKKNFINDEASLKALASALNSKTSIDFSKEENKAIRFSDATTTGDFGGDVSKYGEIDINKQPTTEILGDIDILPAIAKNDGEIGWDGYDESLVDIYNANEMSPAEFTEALKKSEIKLMLKEHKAKMAISSRVITNPNSIAILDRNIVTLNNVYDRKLAKQVFQDIIDAANKNAIDKFATTEADAPISAATREDVRLFPSKLLKAYAPNAILYISRPFINALFSKEVSDGHLPTEQFFYAINGLSNLVTPEKAYIVRTFEHNQIGNYKSLHDGSTNITTDYVPGGSSNDGKLLAFIADLKFCYKLVPSSLGVIGYDNSLGDLLGGSVVAGKISYAAQGLVAKQAIKVLYAKSS